jgi:DNA-binding transcriptional ArsR family regulator
MKDGPDIARVAALVGDPARANMLSALMSGKSLTATDLANEAGVTPPTASSHLSKLEQGGLIKMEAQGRNRYFKLSGTDVAKILEGLMTLASRTGHLRTPTGPREPELRHARVCYDHLAGDLGVALFDALVDGRILKRDGDDIGLTAKGERLISDLGINLFQARRQRRPLCRTCLDWSERRSHLAGTIGAALLDHVYARGWAKRDRKGRAVIFTPAGERAFRKTFGLAQS